MQCPECSSDHEIYIVADVTVLLGPEGSREIEGHDWNRTSRCICGACGHAGIVRDFSCSATGHQGDPTTGARS
jgi:hypothetical protein